MEKPKRTKFDFFLVVPIAIGLFLAVAFVIFGLMRILDMIISG